LTRKFNLILKTIYLSELRLRSSDLDMASLREKLDQARMDSLQESEETMAELKNVYEREKLMLMEENKKLQFEYERTVEINNRLQLERRQFEEDYHDLRNKKEAVAQWEAQISEIINWVSDEKDARGYLQALASKMTEELEYLKHSGTSPSEKNWKNRRSQKLEKMELLNLQSNLQSEIHAKQAINEELSKVRAELESSRMDIREYKSRVESYSREMLRKEAQIRDMTQRLENGDGTCSRSVILGHRQNRPVVRRMSQNGQNQGQNGHNGRNRSFIQKIYRRSGLFMLWAIFGSGILLLIKLSKTDATIQRQ